MTTLYCILAVISYCGFGVWVLIRNWTHHLDLNTDDLIFCVLFCWTWPVIALDHDTWRNDRYSPSHSKVPKVWVKARCE